MEGGWDRSQAVQLWSPPVGTGALVWASEGRSEVQTAWGGDAYQTVVRPSFSSSPAGLPLSSEWLRWPWPELNVAVHLKNLPVGTCLFPDMHAPRVFVYCFKKKMVVWWCVTEGIWEWLIFVCLLVGPDICGFDIKTVHVILHFKNQYHANKKSIRCKVNAFLLHWWSC